MRVAVLAGGPSAERDVSLRSGRAVEEALRRAGLRPVFVEIGRDPRRWFFAGSESDLVGAVTRLRQCDVAFPLVHGPFGEDGTLQGFLDVVGVRYVGSAVGASALAMDKIQTRRVVRALGVRIAPGLERVGASARGGEADLLAEASRFGPTWFVKPARLGSSVAVSRVEAVAALAAAVERARAAGGGVVVEGAVEGTEASVPVLDVGGRARALEPVRIEPRSGAFFDYDAKYTPEATREICPSGLSEALVRRLGEVAVRIHREFGMRSLSRADFVVPPGGEPVFLETNSLPGMTGESLYPKAARASGIEFPELCRLLVEDAVTRR